MQKDKYLMGNENVFCGNITAKGMKSIGNVKVFDISMYNGKGQDPFFVQVKVFNNTDAPKEIKAKDRVRVYGALRLNKWGEDQSRQTIIVNANKIEMAPWQGAGAGADLPKESFEEEELRF